MPNWCSNTLTISGKTHDVARFIEAIQLSDDEQGGESRYDLTALYPCPIPQSEINESDSNKMPKWWNWRVNNWGTKWPPIIYGEQFSDFLEHYKKGRMYKEVTEYFQTAWSPPLGLMEKIAEMFPELSFELSYYETGCCFKGERRYEDGEQVYEDDSDLTWQDQLDMDITDLESIIHWEMASKEEIVTAGYATEEEVDEIMAEMEE